MLIFCSSVQAACFGAAQGPTATGHGVWRFVVRAVRRRLGAAEDGWAGGVSVQGGVTLLPRVADQNCREDRFGAVRGR